MTKRINVKNILRVADAIEKAARPEAKPKVGYYQPVFICVGEGEDIDATGHRCTTTACIAGWAVLVFDRTRPRTLEKREQEGDYVSDRATKLLGLGSNQADDLFLHVYSETPDQAVRTLRHLAKTGEVNWSVMCGT